MNNKINKSIDVNYLLERLGGDKDLASQIFEVYVQQVPDNVKNMLDYLEGENIEKLKKEAHVLKGSSSNIGADKISAYAKKIENEASTDNIADIKKDINDLQEEFENLKEYLKSNDFI